MSETIYNMFDNIDIDILTDNTSLGNISGKNGFINEQNPILDFDIFAKINKFKNCVCKLRLKKDTEPVTGTGFFCYIPSKEIRFLITNNHLINGDYLNKEKKLICYFESKDNEIEKIINLESKRYKYTDKVLDATIIEILNDDYIDDFFEVDENFIKDKEFIDELVLNIQFPRGGKLKASFGKIIRRGNKRIQFIYDAGSDNGSSGSPIILENGLKVIGIHRSGTKPNDINKKINLGIYLDNIIKCIPKQNHPENQNVIKCIYNIKNDDLNKDIKIYDNKKYIQSKIKSINILSEEEQKNIVLEGKYRFKKEGKHYIYITFDNKVDNLSNMFYNCSSLNKVYIPSFPDNQIEDMSNMFQGCTSLTEINFLPSFNTQNVIDMSKMFLSCESLENINLSFLNTENVIFMSGMFFRCQSIKEIDLSSFNTEKVTDMSNMFNECIKLEKIDLSSFNIKNVSNMSSMFENCNSLEKLDLSSFGGNNISTMNNIFKRCESLEEIDLSKINLQNNTNVDYMFKACSSLKTIKCCDKKIISEFKKNKSGN